MRHLIRLIYPFFVLGALAYAAPAHPSATAWTPAERAYIESHPVIHVQNETNWPPFNFRENGQPKGFSIDYMNALARQIGIRIEYVGGHSWEAFIRMLHTPALDAMVNVSITDERKKTMVFTHPFMHAKNAIYTNVKKQAYYTLEELNGKRVALVKDFFIQKYISNHYPRIHQVLVPDLPKALELLSFAKVDAVVGKQVVVDYILRENLISSVMATDYIKNEDTISHLAIAADKNDTTLIRILDKAQRQLDPKTIERLKHKWFGINVLLNTREILTPEEQAYLRGKQRLKICYQSDRLPIEAEGEIGPKGIAIDVIKSLIRRLDIDVAFLPTLSQKESWQFLQEKRCDLLPGAIQLDGQDQHVLFTKPYLSYSPVIVMRKGAPTIDHLDQLNGKTYAVWEETPILQERLKGHAPILNKPNILQALQAVQNGEADYTVVPRSIFAYFQQRESYDDLAVAGYAPVRLNLSIAVTKSAPELLGILNKILQATPKEAFRAINDKWVSSTVIHKTDYVAFLEVLGGALVIITLILLAYRRQRQLTHRIEELNATLEERIAEALKKNKEQEAMMLHQDRLARMGEMIAMIAHQWRQPLNNLALVNQVLISKYQQGKLDDVALAYFKRHSQRLITQMSETIDDFRNFYKIEKERVDFCVSDVVEELIDQTRIIFKDAGIMVTYSAKGCPLFHGYPNELKHAVQNIMSNAKDALDDKETNGSKRITVTVAEEADNIVIRIRDNAGGIPPEVREKIFDPYFSTKEAKNGTGLGLYMANVIIAEHMHSQIEVLSDEEGTEFIIRLQRVARLSVQ